MNATALEQRLEDGQSDLGMAEEGEPSEEQNETAAEKKKL